MKLVLINIILLLSIFRVGSAQVATLPQDEFYFKEARAALDKKDCSSAFNTLSKVSIDGKDQPEYLKLMAAMH